MVYYEAYASSKDAQLREKNLKTPMPNLKKELSIVSERYKSGGGKGVSIYLSLMIMTILLAIGLGISTIVVSQMKMLKGMGDSVIAIHTADTGVERVLYAISVNDLSQNYQGVVGDASYNASLVCGKDYAGCLNPLQKDSNCLASYYCLKSVGTYKDTKRAIEVTR